MICTKCKSEVVQGTNYCPWCGKKLNATKRRRTKSRGNGTGCAYYDAAHRYWIAQVVSGYRDLPPFNPDDPENMKNRIPIKRTKGGFARKEDALAYCQILKNGPQKPDLAPTLAHYWETYKDGAYQALSASKQQAYRTAWKKLEPISQVRIDQLTVSDLQQIVGEKCKTYYTSRDCKVLLTNLYRIAASERYVSKDVPSFIQLPKMEESERETFSETERRVRVEGEAYFRVAHNEQKPFIVETDGQEIRVLGTEFNVHSYAEDKVVETTLVKGSIAMRPAEAGDAQLVLTPGHQAVFDKSAHDINVRSVDTEVVTSWREGKFVFENQTLEQLMLTLSRWYDFTYEFADAKAATTVFMGRIPRYADFDDVVAILESSGGLSIRIKERKVFIKSK